MQTMIDALYPGGIFLDDVAKNAQLVAAYIDHNKNPQSYQQAVARFPNKIHIKISSHGMVGAHVLDCEPSTGTTPADCVPWAVNSRKAGIAPTVYCNELSKTWGWTNVKAEFDKAKVAQPMYWVANYSRPAGIPAGAVGHQYNDLDANGNNSYDVSIMLDSWPQEVDVSLDQSDKDFITNAIETALTKGYAGIEEDKTVVRSLRDWVRVNNYRINHDVLDAVRSSRAAVLAAIAKIPGADVDETALAQALIPLLVPALAAQLPQIPQSELESALTNVLGSLND